jgi:type IV secretion system protein VirB10
MAGEEPIMRRACVFILRASFACAALVLLTHLPSALSAADIPKGTHVLLRLENSITSRTAQAGDVVYFRTASPIIVDSRVVVQPGCFAQGTVTLVKRPGRVAGRGELGLRLDSLALPNGRVFQFSGTVESVDAEGTGQTATKKEGTVRQGSDGGRDAGTVVTRGAQGAALGAIVDRSATGAGIGGGAGAAAGLAQVLLTRGRDVELRRGSTVDVVIDRPMTSD